MNCMNCMSCMNCMNCIYGCMCVCVSVYMCVCLYLCLYVCVSVCMSLDACMHACVRAWMDGWMDGRRDGWTYVYGLWIMNYCPLASSSLISLSFGPKDCALATSIQLGTQLKLVIRQTKLGDVSGLRLLLGPRGPLGPLGPLGLWGRWLRLLPVLALDMVNIKMEGMEMKMFTILHTLQFNCSLKAPFPNDIWYREQYSPNFHITNVSFRR